MNILVTGGAGFIGTNFIRLLMEESDHAIVNFDALTYAGNRAGTDVFAKNKRYSFVHADITDRVAVDSAISSNKIDAVVNFAAESHVDRSIHDASVFIRTNIEGTQVLLDAARKHGIKRFLQVSTDEVYGDLHEGDPAFTEKTPICPSSPYSASKAAADHLVYAAHRTHGMPVVITRCSNNYGPYQFPEKFIPLMILRAKYNEPLPVYGKGLNIRDWIYVADHCRGVLAALERGREGEAYNFGGASEKRNIEVAHIILKSQKRGEELIKYVTDRPGHDLRYAIDFTKAKRDLGWTPRIDFADGIIKTIEWYSANEAWLNEVASPQFKEFFKKHYGAI